MYVVKIRKTRNQRGTEQVHVTIPYMIARQFPEADTMMIEYDYETETVVGTPLLNEKLSKEMAIKRIEELKAKIEEEFGIPYEEMQVNN